MKLEGANKQFSSEVCVEDIKEAFKDDYNRGEFLILFKDKVNFIQIAGEYDGPFILEYQDGNLDYIHKCVNKVSKGEAKDTFVKYLKGDSKWKTKHEWEKIEYKPWWKFW
jgi:hypothetical protein